MGVAAPRALMLKYLEITTARRTFSSLKQSTVYADLPSFLSPCLIKWKSFPLDLLPTDAKILYTLELTVGIETNIQNNSDRKAAKYSSLINDLSTPSVGGAF